MNLVLVSIVLIVGLIILLAIGTEIAVSFGIIAGIGLLVFSNQSLNQFASAGWTSMYSFTLTSIPIFVFMGTVFANTGVLRSLFSGAHKLIGGMPGGVANSVIGANAIFGAISGSSLAATATFGRMALPEMERLGYDAKLSLGSIAVSGGLSALIPPSLIMIVYGGMLDVSISRLFAGGIIPGVIQAVLLVLTVTAMVKMNPGLAPKAEKFPAREKILALAEIAPFMVVIVLVLGVIFLGVMTPTEAASIGALLSIVLALLYRRMTFRALKASMQDAVKITAMLALLLTTASVLGQVFQYVGLTDAFKSLMMELNINRYAVLTLIVVLYLVLGCFLDAFSMLTLTVPFIGPLLSVIGFDPLWFGIIFTVLVQIGVITPPFGLHLFVLKSVAPKYDIMTIARGSFPLLIPLFATILIVTIFPELVMWLPGVLYR